MAIELFNDGNHIVLGFYDLVDEGNMTHTGLLMGMSKYCRPQEIDYLFASHAAPDIIASVNKWMIASHAKVYIASPPNQRKRRIASR
jgi:flavorubredoxin